MILQREMRYRSLAIRTGVAAVAGGAIAVVLALRGYGVWALVCYQIVYALVGVMLLWRASSWRPSFQFSRPHFREMFLFGVNIFAVNVIDVVNKRSDQFLIGLHLGSSALGYYSVATRFYQALMSIFVSPLSRVASSTFSRMQDQPVQFLQAFYKAIELASVFAFPAFTGAYVLCPELIALCFSPKWLECVPVVRAFLVIGALYSVTFFHGAALRAMGKPNWHLGLVILHVVTNVILYLAVVRHGMALPQWLSPPPCAPTLFSLPIFWCSANSCPSVLRNTGGGCAASCWLRWGWPARCSPARRRFMKSSTGASRSPWKLPSARSSMPASSN